jgi:hypothetical protein
LFLKTVLRATQLAKNHLQLFKRYFTKCFGLIGAEILALDDGSCTYFKQFKVIFKEL